MDPAPHDLPPATNVATTGDPSPDLLWVERWDDPGPDRGSPAGAPMHGLRSGYVEEFWLPVLGPSCVLLLRLIDRQLDDHPGGFTLNVDDTARALGIGHRRGRNSPMARTLQRCCSFGAARMDGGHQLVVRPGLPSLSARQVARLPEPLRQRHHDVPAPASSVADLRSRCRTLAQSLLEVGELPDDAEHQLHRWHFHPAMAHEAVQWALRQGTGAPMAGAPSGRGTAPGLRP